jgi:hypothetical protein
VGNVSQFQISLRTNSPRALYFRDLGLQLSTAKKPDSIFRKLYNTFPDKFDSNFAHALQNLSLVQFRIYSYSEFPEEIAIAAAKEALELYRNSIICTRTTFATTSPSRSTI